MQKRWVEHDVNDKSIVTQLADQLNIDTIIATLLVKRDITGFEEARTFFRPLLDHLHDPFLMKDMDKAITRIEQAIIRREKILIYGDYDVDGTTAVSLVYSFFRSIYADMDYYIPNRYAEGYGISYQGIDWALENNFSLIIALDCGIKAIEQVQYASERGIDFIICDHHLAGNEIPDAVAVLDPKRFDCPYPYKELSGCGIGFKLVQAFAINNGISTDTLIPLLDLVVVSIASDIVHVTGENRVLAHYGLLALNNHPQPGLKALLDLAGNKQNLSISDIVFSIGPRINAAGRIDDARKAVHLLTASNSETAFQKGSIVNSHNVERKNFDAIITAEALSMLERDRGLQSRKSTVLYSPDWHKGVIGIVASRLIEKYYRPTIILTNSNDMATGSARSVRGFDIYTAICSCSELLEQFGGHKYAAGLTLKIDNIPAFIEKFEDVVSSTITEDSFNQDIDIDSELMLRDITSRFVRILKQFAPFGPGNMNPVFITKNVWTPYSVQVVGGNHLKFTVCQENSPAFECIAFNMLEYEPLIRKGLPFNICYTIEENNWNNKKSVQLNIKDIRA